MDSPRTPRAPGGPFSEFPPVEDPFHQLAEKSETPGGTEVAESSTNTGPKRPCKLDFSVLSHEDQVADSPASGAQAPPARSPPSME